MYQQIGSGLEREKNHSLGKNDVFYLCATGIFTSSVLGRGLFFISSETSGSAFGFADNVPVFLFFFPNFICFIFNSVGCFISIPLYPTSRVVLLYKYKQFKGFLQAMLRKIILKCAFLSFTSLAIQ